MFRPMPELAPVTRIAFCELVSAASAAPLWAESRVAKTTMAANKVFLQNIICFLVGLLS
jgi:hypothetical protein